MILKTLNRIGSPLSSPELQRGVLAQGDVSWPGRFRETVADAGLPQLRSLRIKVLQVNVGKVCNQTCSHCHVDAGPDRRESMSRGTAEQVIEFLANSTAESLDITGGAPEMNPNFRWLVQQASSLGKQITNRCNLTILLAKGFQDLPEFLAKHRVDVIASLPCYLQDNCDSQRGSGTFEKSIQAIKILNSLGYGQPDSGLELSLVHNPIGASLPSNQAALEAEFRQQLDSRFGIRFTRLLAITNMPISRFLDDLLHSGKYDEYMQTLIAAFNPRTLDGLMCREMLSVDWNGYLFDCDFNQMLDIPVNGKRIHISECRWNDVALRTIQTGNHCFGCTAGCGSSCLGTVVS